VVVTVVKDDVIFLNQLITSMERQTKRPDHWVIVDDSSIDGTANLASEASGRNEWISFIPSDGTSLEILPRSERIARLFSLGVGVIDLDWDLCSKIDADMTLDKGYFSSIIGEFNKNPNLGIASGNCFINIRGRKVRERVTKGHTRGGLKTYRRECFDAISGIPKARGWDSIDNIRACMLGWETHNFPDLLAEHKRPTGQRKGLVKTSFDEGVKSHFLGYSVPYLIARSVHRMFRRPFFISGLAMLMGFFYGIISRSPKFEGKEETKLLRRKQISKITLGLIPTNKK